MMKFRVVRRACLAAASVAAAVAVLLVVGGPSFPWSAPAVLAPSEAVAGITALKGRILSTLFCTPITGWL